MRHPVENCPTVIGECPSERLEVLDTGRRRRWSEGEKLKIVQESLQAPRQTAATARRYSVSRSILLRCNGLFVPSRRMLPIKRASLPAMVVAESGRAGRRRRD